MGLEWSVKIDYLCPPEKLEERQDRLDTLIKKYDLQVQNKLIKPAKEGTNYVRVLASGCAVKSFCKEARKELPYASVLAINQLGVVVKERDGFFGFFRKKENGFALDDISLIKSKAPEVRETPEIKYEADDNLIGISFSYKTSTERFKTMFKVIEVFREYQVKIRRHEENYEKKESYIIVAAPEDAGFYARLQGMKAIKTRRMLACLVPVKPEDHLEELLKKTFESARKPAPAGASPGSAQAFYSKNL